MRQKKTEEGATSVRRGPAAQDSGVEHRRGGSTRWQSGAADQKGGFAKQRGGFGQRRGDFGQQRGGFAVGLIVGLLIGLAAALGVALYVTKVPIPFVNKVPQRTADQDAAEIEKNRNWDPNSALSGKSNAKTNPNPNPPPNAGSSGATAPPPPPSGPVQPPVARSAPRPFDFPTPAVTGSVTSTTPPSGSPPDGTTTTARQAPPTAFDRPGADAPAAGPDPFIYFVQAGAYGRPEDAEQQRAKLALLGLSGKLSERDQSGRTVYRVRIGPFNKRADADSTKQRLVSAGVETALVRVQR